MEGVAVYIYTNKVEMFRKLVNLINFAVFKSVPVFFVSVSTTIFS